MKERYFIAEGQISFEEAGDPNWKDKTGRKTSKKLELLELREKQFLKIDRIKEEMKKNKDERHLFLIKRSTVISSKEKRLFKGNLSQDVLAIEEENCLNLKPLIPEDKIIINYFDPIIGERVRWPIRQFQIQKEGVDCLDLMSIRNAGEFWGKMAPKK
jgi:hypothetical protein